MENKCIWIISENKVSHQQIWVFNTFEKKYSELRLVATQAVTN